MQLVGSFVSKAAVGQSGPSGLAATLLLAVAELVAAPEQAEAQLTCDPNAHWCAPLTVGERGTGRLRSVLSVGLAHV